MKVIDFEIESMFLKRLMKLMILNVVK